MYADSTQDLESGRHDSKCVAYLMCDHDGGVLLGKAINFVGAGHARHVAYDDSVPSQYQCAVRSRPKSFMVENRIPLGKNPHPWTVDSGPIPLNRYDIRRFCAYCQNFSHNSDGCVMKDRIVEDTEDYLSACEDDVISRGNETMGERLKRILREQSCPLTSIPKGNGKGKGKGKGKGDGPPSDPRGKSGGGSAGRRGGKGASHPKGAHKGGKGGGYPRSHHPKRDRRGNWKRRCVGPTPTNESGQSQLKRTPKWWQPWMKDRSAKEWAPWMELGGGNANHDKRADQFIYDMDEKLKVETRHLVTLSVLTTFMSSEVQPMGLPYDRGRKKRFDGNRPIFHVTSESTPEQLLQYLAPSVASEAWLATPCYKTEGTHRSLDEEQVSVPAENDQKHTRKWQATKAYAKHMGLNPHRVEWDDVCKSSAGADGWYDHFWFGRDQSTTDGVDTETKESEEEEESPDDELPDLELSEYEGEYWEDGFQADDFIDDGKIARLFEEGEHLKQSTTEGCEVNKTQECTDASRLADSDCNAEWHEEPHYGMDDFVGLQKAMSEAYDGCSPRVMVLGQERPVATGDMSQSKFPVVANLENITRPGQRKTKWRRVSHERRYERKSRPIKGAEEGLPWPEMRTRTEAIDGSIMVVLDSGAEVSVINQLSLIPRPFDIPLPVVSFNGAESSCKKTGEAIGGVKDTKGGMRSINLGFTGHMTGTMRDNLASVPVMRKMGYQFWFGDHPFCLTPEGVEIPLYVSSSGYLALRMHTAADADIDPLESMSERPRQVGYLSNDVDLWHTRMVHQPRRVLLKMQKNKLVVGMPALRTYTTKDKCLSCALGKSTRAHVGPVTHADQQKMMKVKGDMEDTKDGVYYPLEQLHLDCCEMDAPDLYGNTHFLVIVDRATSMMWTIPLKDKRDLYKLLDKFILTVVEPYHKLKTNRDLRKMALEKIGESEVGTESYKKGMARWDTITQLKELEKSVSGLRKIRCDRGTEFDNAEMKSMLTRHGVELDMVPAYVNDGRAEAAIKKLVTFTRCCLIDANLKKVFWSSVMSMVTHVLNRSYNGSLKAVPYSLMTGLKPVVSYFRQPGSIAFCHKQDRYRTKLDNTAFLGITIGYDTAEKSWIFLNPATGRTVRTIHATFYERSRDPQEHIDMSHMVIEDPKWQAELKVRSWRCQLWPRVLWPGMASEKMGNTKAEFPLGSELPEGFDHDGLTFDRSKIDDQDRGKKSSVSKKGKSGDSGSSAEAEQPDYDLQRHAFDLTDAGGVSTYPGNVVTLGVDWAKAKAKYIRDRRQAVSGRRISDLFDAKNKPLVKVPGPTAGQEKLYSWADFMYDLKGSGLSTVPGQDESEQPEDEKQVLTEKSSLRSTRKTRRQPSTHKVQFFGQSVKVYHLFDEKEFDWMVLPNETSDSGEHSVDPDIASEEEEDVFHCWGKGAETGPTSFNVLGVNGKKTRLRSHIVCGDAAMFRSVQRGVEFDTPLRESNVKHRSCPIPGAKNVIDVPTTDELVGYRMNGTYVDSRGNIRPSHHVKRAVSHWHESCKAAVVDGVASSKGVPTPAGMRNISQQVGGLIPLHVPKGSKKAMTDPKYSPHWKEAVYKELNTLNNMGCFDLIREDHPDVKIVGVLPSHFVFTDKWTADTPPKFSKVKARLVAGGNFEKPEEDPFANFSPTAGPSINRFFDAYCVRQGFMILSSDVSSAFIASSVGKKKIFVRPPPGVAPRGYVFKCNKMLYGLRNSPQAWMKLLTKTLKQYGFRPFRDDPCILRRVDDEGDEIVVEAFVDDVKWGGKDVTKIRKVIETLHRDHFKMTFEGEVSTYLGMHYVHSVDEKGMKVMDVNQTEYVGSLGKRFKLDDDSYHATARRGRYDTPLPAVHSVEQLRKQLEVGIDEDEGLKKWAAEFSFPTLVGSVIHAMVHTRPDIAYAVSFLSRAMSRAELWHYKAMRHLLMYMVKTKELGLHYSQQNMLAQETLVTAAVDEDGHIHDKHLTASVDAAFGDCPITFRSTSGFVVWFGGSPIEFECKLQSLVTLSTMESEWVAASKCISAIRFVHKLLEFVGLRRTGPTKVMEDNAAVVACSTRTVHKARSKHIGTKWMNVREACQSQPDENGVGQPPECTLVSVWTEHQVSDVFTKSLGKNDFERCRETLMGRVPFDVMVANHQKKTKTVGGVSSYKTPNGKTIAYSGAPMEGGVARTQWPRQVVTDDQQFGKNYMSLRDCIMGRPAFDIPGYNLEVCSA
jgi:hypothetical protein